MQQRVRQAVAWLAVPDHFLAVMLSLIPAAAMTVFMVLAGSRYPIDDTVNHNWRLIIEPLAMGDFDAREIARSNQGHRAVYTNLLTLFSYYAFGWSMVFETAMLFVITLCNTLLLVALFARHTASRTHWFLVPAAALMFSVQQGILYISPRASHWHFSTLFVLMVVVVLVYRPRTPGTVALATALSFAGTFTMGNGMTVWGVGVLAMWLVGYRDLRYYIAYVVAGAGALALYVLPGDFGTDPVTQRDDMERIEFMTPWDMARFVAAYVGAPVSAEYHRVALWVGSGALAVLAANSVYLWRAGKRYLLAAWLPVAAYGVGTGLLLTIGRNDALIRAVFERTGMSAQVFWVALVAVVLLGWFHARDHGHRWILNANSVVLVAALGGHLTTLVLRTDTYRENKRVADLLTHERCMEGQAFRVAAMPAVCAFDATQPEIDRMAAFNLAGYRQVQLPLLFPPTDDPTLIITEDALHGIHIRDRMLQANKTLHLFAEDTAGEGARTLPRLPQPPDRVFDGLDAVPPGLLTQQDRLSVVVHGGALEALWEPLVVDLPPTYLPYTVQTNADYDLHIWRYARVPNLNETAINYGGVAQLVGWWVPSSLETSACAEVRLQSVWARAGVRPDNPLALTFVLSTPDGTRVASADGLMDVPEERWVADAHYLDERALTIPCDTPPGTYPLLLGAYDYTTTEAHPAFYADGGPVGGLYYLTNVTVE